ncbi:hypothetical protein BJ508DRAFT_324084 [Ascobolus immersus RN42]|uniref:Uncharacterized protein n=1 Tax=Ascobolus immersus RN42 TaxID=1160509 RepID=A0A3N4IHD9_ASCIM|nr:hypothetical protein BJ508DRAFT_324084 [Ascobolus immersus RN42]
MATPAPIAPGPAAIGRHSDNTASPFIPCASSKLAISCRNAAYGRKQRLALLRRSRSGHHDLRLNLIDDLEKDNKNLINEVDSLVAYKASAVRREADMRVKLEEYEYRILRLEKELESTKAASAEELKKKDGELDATKLKAKIDGEAAETETNRLKTLCESKETANKSLTSELKKTSRKLDLKEEECRLVRVGMDVCGSAAGKRGSCEFIGRHIMGKAKQPGARLKNGSGELKSMMLEQYRLDLERRSGVKKGEDTPLVGKTKIIDYIYKDCFEHWAVKIHSGVDLANKDHVRAMIIACEDEKDVVKKHLAALFVNGEEYCQPRHHWAYPSGWDDLA